MDPLQSLNERQKEAVIQKDGPVLILAGAGAGKTKTLTHRILNLIKNGVAPQEVLAITFTNKAAKEMRERVHALLSQDQTLNLPVSLQGLPFVSTFHSLGVHVLKENAKLIGLPRHFAIYDKSDSKRAAKEAIIAAGLDPKQWEPGRILNMISREKGNFTTLEEFERAMGNEYMPNIVSRIWRGYEKILQQEKACDFDDLLLKTARLLKTNPDVKAHYQNKWKYFHIDEYQDTNKVQYSISKMLSEKSRNLCVVGDIDQMIYSWRGADITNILNFEKDYPDAKVILLEENYRSTQTILMAANTIIKKNKQRREKNLFTKNAAGEKISLFGAYDEEDEAYYIAEKSQAMIEAGTPANEIAVLYRANFQSRVLEEAFLARGVPYQVLGVRFFERKEVKDILAYLRLAMTDGETGDMKRVINVPTRGIGKVGLLKILAGQAATLPAGTKAKYDEFRLLLEKIKEKATTEKPSETLKFIIKESGLEASFKQSGTEEDAERIENMKELVTLATKYDYLPAEEGIEMLLEEASLQSDQDALKSDERAVKLMTVHASKGLEFNHVFVSGLEDGLFPHQKPNDDGDIDTEEERRLFYVALTRARKKLHLTFAGMRTIFGSKQIGVPSEFIMDIDEDLLQAEEREGKRGKTIYFD
jgi:DNA helicase II / ATP-dependent DNA helicase PcrA